MGYIEPSWFDEEPVFCKDIPGPRTLYSTLLSLMRKDVIIFRHQNFKISVIADLKYDLDKNIYSFRVENDPNTVVELSPDEFVRIFNEESFEREIPFSIFKK